MYLRNELRPPTIIFAVSEAYPTTFFQRSLQSSITGFSAPKRFTAVAILHMGIARYLVIGCMLTLLQYLTRIVKCFG